MRHYRTGCFPKSSPQGKQVGKHWQTNSLHSMRYGNGWAILTQNDNRDVKS